MVPTATAIFAAIPPVAAAVLLAFGVSAINQVQDTYAQNFKDINAYQDALQQGHLPLNKGFAFKPGRYYSQSGDQPINLPFSARFRRH